MTNDNCSTCKYRKYGKKRGEFVCQRSGYIIYIPADQTSCQYYEEITKKGGKKK